MISIAASHIAPILMGILFMVVITLLEKQLK